MTDAPVPEPRSLKDSIRHFVPPRLWSVLRQGTKRSTDRLGRTLVGAATQITGPGRALCLLYDSLDFTPELVIQGYLQGIGPFASHGVIHWYDPDPRGLLPITEYHVSKTTRRIVRQGRFSVTVDRDFAGTIRGCAEARPGRETTFITPAFIEAYLGLHAMGLAHSVEAWQGDRLVGGVFGLALGAYFVSESQFTRVDNAGKVALVHLLAILRAGGFLLHDAFWC